jgi:hypothetical protein
MFFKSLRLISLTALIASIGIPFTFEHRATAGSTPEDVIQGELVVELRQEARIEAVNARNLTSTIEQMDGTNIYRLRLPSGQSEKSWQKRLAADPDVLSADSNRVVASPISVFARRTMAFPDNFAEPGHTSAEYLSQKKFQDLLKLDKALVRSRGEGIVIAVIDTGVELTHPSLASHIWANPLGGNADGYPGDDRGWNFVERNGDPGDPPGDPMTTVAGHGTFIAGLIALAAPDALIMPIRAFPSSGVGDAFTVAEGIKFASDHGADIINLSFGCPSRVGVLHDAIVDARKRGIVMAAAVGNDNDDATQYPAGFSRVLGVGATDMSLRKAVFSNFGADVSVDAPGVGLISTYPNGDFAKWSGTSFASPLVTAEAALILAHDRLIPEPLKTIEESSVGIDDLNPEFRGLLGSGLIDPVAALKSLYTPASVAAFKNLYIELAMSPAETIRPAQGEVDISLSSLGQELRIAAYRLKPRANYTLVVDGIAVKGAQLSSNMGSLVIDLSSKDGLPSPLTSIRHVQLLSEQNLSVLDGVFGSVASGKAPPGEVVEKEAWLWSDSDGAAGRAVAKIDSNGQTLEIEGDGLLNGASYQLFADGVNLGNAIALTGYCHTLLTTEGSTGVQLPKSLWPATSITHIEMRDGSGKYVILQGDFKPGGNNIGQGN